MTSGKTLTKRVFVDSGAWIALALTRDPLHPRALDAWDQLNFGRVRWVTSVPIVLETFTFLDRNARREVALRWQEALSQILGREILECSASQVNSAWEYFRDPRFHRLSAVDATSFVLMKAERIGSAFAFDHHFSVAGFSLVG